MNEREPPFLGHDGMITLAAALVVAVLTCGLAPLATAIAVLRTARRAGTTPTRAPGCILVLGHRLVDGGLSPDFAARLARALGLATAYPAARVMVLGGRAAAGLPSEAEVGRAWLVAHGLDAACIGIETRSRHTLENLYNHRAARGNAGPEALVTSRLHLHRAMLMAHGLGLALDPVAAEERARLIRPRLLVEGFLVHWYLTGRALARVLRRWPWLARIA